jgi:hypothetical protein
MSISRIEQIANLRSRLEPEQRQTLEQILHAPIGEVRSMLGLGGDGAAVSEPVSRLLRAIKEGVSA